MRQRQNGVDLERLFIHANETLPPLDSCDLLVAAGGPQQVWEASRHAWMRPEKDFIRKALALQFHPEFSLATVRHYAATQGNTWPPGPFVTPPLEFQRQSQARPDTYPLMKAILDTLALCA